MSRRAHLIILELGASASAWAARSREGVDECILLVQQLDEGTHAFAGRIRHRMQRLRGENAQIASMDVYASPRGGVIGCAASDGSVAELCGQLSDGASLTLWSASEDRRTRCRLTAILASCEAALADRQIAVVWGGGPNEERSGVRHAMPSITETAADRFDFRLG